MTYPGLLLEYIEFCTLREKYVKLGPLELSKQTPINITTFLPLQILIEAHRNQPGPRVPQAWMPTVQMALDLDTGKINIPTHHLGAEEVFSTLMKNNDSRDYGGDNAFMYMIGEVIDNVYQHSGFSYGCVAAHTSASGEYADLSVFDEGITIRTRFQK